MKIKTCIFALAVGILIGCSQNSFDEMDEQMTNQVSLSSDNLDGSESIAQKPFASEAVQHFMDHYIVPDGYIYKVLLNKSEAMKLGVTSEEYNQICKEVETGNKMIVESIESYNTQENVRSVRIIDGRTNTVIYEVGNRPDSESIVDIPMLKNGAEEDMPSGTLRASGYSYESTTSFFTTLYMRYIGCVCRAPGYWNQHEVITEIGGHTDREILTTNGYVQMTIWQALNTCTLKYNGPIGGECHWTVF